jgi:hypothetical protein
VIESGVEMNHCVDFTQNQRHYAPSSVGVVDQNQAGSTIERRLGA